MEQQAAKDLLASMSLEELVDEIGELRELLDLASEKLKDDAEDQIPDDGPLKIKGAKFEATISKRHTVAIPPKVAEAFWERVGAGKAKNFFKRATKVTYSKITDAVKALLENPQSDKDLQDGKKLLKAGMKEEDTIAVKLTEIKT